MQKAWNIQLQFVQLLLGSPRFPYWYFSFDDMKHTFFLNKLLQPAVYI